MTISKIRIAIASLCAFTAWLFPAIGVAADYTVTSLEWPPYTAADLPAQGALSAVVRAAFEAVDSKLTIEFYPWSRAVQISKTKATYIAYFPEYHSAANEADFYYSDPIGTGPLVLTAPVIWSDYDSLTGKLIGIVRDYVNTDELDSRIADKTLTADEAPDDAKNILKLASGRVDIAVIDLNVFNYLVKNNADVKSVAERLQVNPKPLADKNLYVCFKKSRAGEQAMKVFNEGLKRVDIKAIMQKWIN